MDMLYWIICALASMLLLVAYILFHRSQKGSAVLLIGLPNSGKTTYWLQVMCGSAGATHTSMKENVRQIPAEAAPTSGLRKKQITLVDLPGHMRLRPLFDHYASQTRAIAFFIDSVDVGENLSPCAELLYSLLTNADLVARGIPIMMVCNKRDIELSYKLVTIKNKLETELNAMRKSKQHEMGTLGDADSVNAKVIPLGVEGQPFAFDHHAPLPLYWCEASVKDRQVQPLTDWIWTVF